MFTFPIHENLTDRTHLLSLDVAVYAMSSMGFMLSAGSFADHLWNFTNFNRFS